MTIKIIKYGCILLISVFLMMDIMFAQSSNNAYRVDTFSTGLTPDVELRTSGGSISIFGHNEDEVRIEMFVRRGSSYLSPSDTDLSDFDILIEQEGNKITAFAKRESSGRSFFWGGSNESISFRAYVPNNSIVDGRTSGGSVSAENIYNNLQLATSGGSVKVQNIQGKIDLSTSGGSIQIEDASGEISARTSGGSVSVNGLEGVADLRTSGGGMRLNNISAKLNARTSGGSIRAELVAFYEDVTLRTSGGSIQISMPDVDHYDLDLRGNRVNTNLRNFSGEMERSRINGRVGNGGPLLSARTSAGSVTIN